MNIGESRELLAQFDQDLANEPDRNSHIWYEEEFKLHTEYIEAVQAMDQVGILAGHLGKIAQIKTEQAAITEAAEEIEAEGPIEPDSIEPAHIPTAEEVLRRRIQKKYETEYDAYQADMASCSGMKKSKRENQERMAQRSFARRFTDFSEVTGNTHIVLDVSGSLLIALRYIEEPALIDEVYANCANYAERHGAEVTANPKNFADIIGIAATNPILQPYFENILKSIYSTRHNTGDFATINQNLAAAAFELLASTRALAKVVNIAFGKEPYITSQHHYEYIKHAMETYLSGDFQKLVDDRQAFIIFGILNNDITGLNLMHPEAMTTASQRVQEKYKEIIESLGLRTRPDFFTSLIFRGNTIRDFDPVSVNSLSGEPLDLHHKPMPDELKALLPHSQLFRKRMQEFAPYTYSVLAAKNVTESEQQNPETLHGLAIPVSPSIALDLYTPIPGAQFEPTAQQTDLMYRRLSEVMPKLLAAIVDGINVSSYKQAGELNMAYAPLFDNNPRKGVVVFRPAIEIDKKTHAAIQYLTINYCKLRVSETSKLAEDDSLFEIFEIPINEYESSNREIRQAIKQQQKRFLGRRPVKFSMSEHYRIAGLNSVSFRYDPKKDRIISLFELDDGSVELQLDKDFNIDINDGPTTDVHDRMKLYYENLILKHVRIWLCEQEVRTSEGTVSETSGNSANMGHFAYLRIRESDGRRYRFSEMQRKYCIEEQGRDLASENERLLILDETGQERNSTYVRENYDPSKPPLEIYYASLD
ncbi:MAG TPA: hypothetical protein VH234_06350 [Candidatus Saccharimonadales bacterium]|jgi:hypothetical protein|nr:hypothetical protein [Candidatus Saccharimonadales bacterium]